MNIEERKAAAGQVLIGGFEGLTVPAEVSDALSEGRLGGTILFRRNIESLEQLVSLNTALHGAAASPIWNCVDQEGGRVVRVHPALGATPIPPMRRLGDIGDVALAREAGAAIAREVAAVGFNVNFTPVLDVDTNPANPIIGDRAFSADPAVVAAMGQAVMDGHLDVGVVPCGKHFPGHGDTDVDSHLGLPILRHDMERLDAVELVPFRALASAGIPMMMTAHILFPALDPEHPATLSPHVIKALLRDEMGYEGLIVSDDLEMAAVADRYGVEESVTRGIRAGCDVFLICRQIDLWTRAFEALVTEAERDSEFDGLLRTAAARVARIKAQHVSATPWQPDEDWRSTVGHASHSEVMGRVV